MKPYFRWSRVLAVWFLVIASIFAAGCSTQAADDSQKANGTLRLPLITPQQGTYRLRQAIFVVTNQSGIQAATLDSESSDANATSLTTSLQPGSYSVKLNDGWTLNHLAQDGSESSVQAALISSNPQSFMIGASVETDLTFRFTTDAGAIVITTGSVAISIDVTPNTNLPQCDPSSSFTCGTGQTCLLSGSGGQAFCAAAGTLPVGSPCNSEQCVAGAQCLRQDPDHPDQGTCLQFCDPTFTQFGCNCVSLGLSNPRVGICMPSPAGTCDLLTQVGCDEGLACQYLGGSFGTCGIPGTTGPGQFCTGETCVAGYQCFFNQCRAFCDLRVSNSCFCESAGTGNVGRCF